MSTAFLIEDNIGNERSAIGLKELAPKSSITLPPGAALTPVQTDIFIAISLGKLPCSCIFLTNHKRPLSTNIKPLIPKSYILIISAIKFLSSSEPLCCIPVRIPSEEKNCLPLSLPFLHLPPFVQNILFLHHHRDILHQQEKSIYVPEHFFYFFHQLMLLKLLVPQHQTFQFYNVLHQEIFFHCQANHSYLYLVYLPLPFTWILYLVSFLFPP